MSRITTTRGLLALAFTLLITLAGPLAAATHEPHAHSAAAPEAAQAAAQAELAPEAAAHGCCPMAADDHATPMAKGCKVGDHGSCCGDCPHCAKMAAAHPEHAHGAMAAVPEAHPAGHEAAPASGCCAMATPKVEDKSADDCCKGGDAAACCDACDHCAKAEGGGCCGHGAARMGEPKAAFACPMHPAVTADEAGKCPECGMKLEAKDGGKPKS